MSKVVGMQIVIVSQTRSRRRVKGSAYLYLERYYERVLHATKGWRKSSPYQTRAVFRKGPNEPVQGLLQAGDVIRGCRL
jgi:hypothetical protein